MKFGWLMWAGWLLWAMAMPVQGQRGTTEDIGGVPETKAFKEDAVQLPRFPTDTGLIEFRPRGSSNNRYYIEAASLSLGEDRVVRYTAVIKSRSGVANVSYEGLRCKDAHYKVYAFGTAAGTWSEARDPQWQDVGISVGNFRFSLYRDYLCDSEAVAGRNARDLIVKLRDDPLHKSNTTKR
jgi:hypothetical protein